MEITVKQTEFKSPIPGDPKAREHYLNEFFALVLNCHEEKDIANLFRELWLLDLKEGCIPTAEKFLQEICDTFTRFYDRFMHLQEAKGYHVPKNLGIIDLDGVSIAQAARRITRIAQGDRAITKKAVEFIRKNGSIELATRTALVCEIEKKERVA